MRPFEPVGVIGLGLMGRGIASCLVASGLKVIGYDHAPGQARRSVAHIDATLRELVRRGITPQRRAQLWPRRFHAAKALADLAPCRFVIETIKEDLGLKRKVYEELEDGVSPQTIIASNTSSLPITVLQAGRKHRGRFIGMHWGEPAQIMRYLEIIPGRHTAARTVRLTRRLGEHCGKEPALLREDIRGFISNRMMYAMMREACHLVEAGIADVETVDRSYRNDMGWWSLLAGPFRWMDLTGIPGYAVVMEGLFPKLSNARAVPKLMRQIVARGAKGIANARGFYPYTKRSAQEWERNWTDFTYDMRRLADKYAPRTE